MLIHIALYIAGKNHRTLEFRRAKFFSAIFILKPFVTKPPMFSNLSKQFDKYIRELKEATSEVSILILRQ